MIYFPSILKAMSLSDIISNITTFVDLKFSLEKWCKGEFDIDWNSVKWGVTVYISFHLIMWVMFW